MWLRYHAQEWRSSVLIDIVWIYLFIGSLVTLYSFLTDTIGAPEISDTERASVVPGYITLTILWGMILPVQAYVETRAYLDRKINETFES
jgi:hypothetical protein